MAEAQLAAPLLAAMLPRGMSTAGITIREASDRDLPVVADLAAITFRAHYPSIITREQIEYMLEHMYSLTALRRQRQEGHVFLLGLHAGEPVAYAAFGVSAEDQIEGLIHKLYILPEHQGRGIGQRLIEHIADRLVRMGRSRLVLTVNRGNISAINFYFKLGFTIRSAVDTGIGGGYFMNDFVMTKRLNTTPGHESGLLLAMR